MLQGAPACIAGSALLPLPPLLLAAALQRLLVARYPFSVMFNDCKLRNGHVRVFGERQDAVPLPAALILSFATQVD
jgi:hypothetical protein